MSKTKIYILNLALIGIIFYGCGLKSSMSDNVSTISKEAITCETTSFHSLQEALHNKECVVKLELSKKGYKRIPTEVFEEFPNLEVLDLRFNEFDSLPERIGKLKKLKKLIIPYGTLRYIDAEIGLLNSLESLNLLHNKVGELPKELCQLKNLKELNLTGNEINSLPGCICELKGLRLLGLSYLPNTSHIDSSYLQKLKSCLPNCRISCHLIE